MASHLRRRSQPVVAAGEVASAAGREGSPLLAPLLLGVGRSVRIALALRALVVRGLPSSRSSPHEQEHADAGRHENQDDQQDPDSTFHAVAVTRTSSA
jgi:hypothetical protein